MIQKLIKIGQNEPGLRRHIKPILDRVSSDNQTPLEWYVKRLRDGLKTKEGVDNTKVTSSRLYFDYDGTRITIKPLPQSHVLNIEDARGSKRFQNIDIGLNKTIDKTIKSIIESIDSPSP